MKLKDRTIPAQIRLDIALDKLDLLLKRRRLNWKGRNHLKGWTIEAAHAVYDMRPDLREEGSKARWCVARSGRQAGLRGAALTEFVENEYRQGTWWKLVPEDILKAENERKCA